MMALLRKKRLAVFIGVLLVVLVVLVLIFGPKKPSQPEPSGPGTPIPPVVVNNPALTIVNVTPAAGMRETEDAFSQTIFEFSAPIIESSVNVTVTPSVTIKARIFKAEPNMLVVQPTDRPWVDDVQYTLKVNYARGVNGEELKQPYEYKFTSKRLTVVDGGDR